MFKYLPISDQEVTQELEKLGKTSLDSLFDSLPDKVRKQTSETLPPAKSELEIRQYFDSKPLAIRHSFLGGNGHNHYIPSIVAPLISRGEFLTAYTPYQPEISQGTLQAMFEFQSMMADLMGVEVSNASLYDGSTAMLEACYMAARITQKRKIITSGLIHPEYLETLQTYSETDVIEYETLPPTSDGHFDTAALKDKLKDVAAVVVQSPNYAGVIENLRGIKDIVSPDVLLIVVVTEAMSLPLLKSPGSLGADIVCGEAQSFGIPLSFGGPWLGFLGTSQKHMRNMPGRLIGQGKDKNGRRAFLVTLAAREQHIRREKATSNICTNQGLMALRCTIYLSVMGKYGLRRAAERSAKFAQFGRQEIHNKRGIKVRYFGQPIFNEFIIDLPEKARDVFDDCVEETGIAPGVIAGDKSLLVAFDETMSVELVRDWVSALESAVK